MLVGGNKDVGKSRAAQKNTKHTHKESCNLSVYARGRQQQWSANPSAENKPSTLFPK
jgi:hypothetical protein